MRQLNNTNVIGLRYGRLTVIKKTVVKKKHWWVEVQCDCGSAPKEVAIYQLRRGSTKSCGCIHLERSTTHGKTHHPLFKIWGQMKSRCYYPGATSYKWYGGKGVDICEEWKEDFQKFYDWSITNGWSKELQLDRVMSSGNYEPGNCRWSNRIQQARNRSDNVRLTYNNETFCLTEWAERTGLTISCLSKRLKRGWTGEKTITTHLISTGKYLRA